MHKTPDEQQQRVGDAGCASRTGIPSVLLHGGEMGKRIRTHDWSTTPLGPFETWPSALHTAAGIVLGARAAMAIGWGPQLTLLYNDAWTALIGDRHPSALGQPARSVFPGLWETVGPLLAGVMSGQGAVEKHDQRLMVNRYGCVEETWFDFSASPIPCADGAIGGVFCVAAEITDHVRAEQALRRNEERLRLAASAARIGTYTRDLRTGEYDWSPGLLALFGLGPNDTLPLEDGVPAAIHPADRERVLAETVDGCQTPTEPDFSSEHRIVLPSGEVRWVLVRGKVAFDEQGQPVRAIGMTADITGRVRAEKALRETERRYGELVQYAPAAIYEIDFRRNRFVSANDAMCRVTGYSREELLAMNPFDLLDAQGRALFQRRIQQWLAGAKPDRNVEFRVKTKDGRTVDAVLDVTFTADEEGRPRGATVVAHDVTDRKRRQRRIHRYNAVLRGINRIFEQVIRSKTEKALGEMCLEVALEVTGSQVGFVGEVGEDGYLHSIAISDMGWAQCRIVDQSGHHGSPGNFVVHGLYGRVIDDEKGFFVNEPSSHPDSVGVPEGHPPLTSFLGVPLIHEGAAIGMLAVANREGGYSSEQQEDLESLAPAMVEALLRRRAEAELRGERSLLDSVMQATDVMLVLLDPQFNFVWVNSAYAERCGIKPEEMVGKNHFALYPDEENEAIFRQVRDTGESVFYRDKPFVFPDQPERGMTYWDWSLAPLKGSDGGVTGLVFSLRETTKFVKADEALRHSEDRARWLARFPEENPSPVLRVSADGTVVYCNAAAAAALDWRCDVGHPLSHDILPRLVDRALADGRAIEQDVELGGTTFRVAVAPVADEGYANLYGIDITERVRAEEALRENNARLEEQAAALSLLNRQLQGLLDALPVGVWITDPNGRVLATNPQANEIWAGEAPLSESVDAYVEYRCWWPDTGKELRPEEQPLARALATGERVTGVVFNIERLDGTTGVLLVGAAPLFGPEGQVLGAVGVSQDITERVQAEEAMRESEELLRTVIENSRDGINMLDLETGRYVFMSPAQVAMTGFTVEEMNDLPAEEAYERVHPDDRGISASQQERVEQGLDIESVVEYRWKVKSGEYRWFSDSRKVLRDDAGKPVALVGTSRDITARKHAEEMLRQYAERLRFLREVDEAILAARSVEEVAQAVVERVPRLLPCLRASVLMRDLETGDLSVLAVYHRGKSELGTGQRGVLGAAESGVLERLARGEPYVVDDLQASSFAAPAVAQLKAEGVRAQVFEPIQIEGQFVGLLVVSMDVPGPVPADQQDVLHDLALQLAVGLEQVRLYEAVQRHAGDLEQLVAERTAALEASEARFRTIFEEAAIGIALADAEGRLMATNPAMQRMLGFGEDELLGMRIFDLTRGVDEPCSGFPEELLSGQRADYAMEQAYARSDGEVGRANMTMSLLHRDTAQAPLTLILAEDITERVQAQEALIRAEKLAVLGRMTTSLAHEINNPIQSVVGCLGLAMEVLADGEDATRFMEVALEESERAARIVHRLRDLTRSEEILREPSDVRKLVDTVLVLTQNQAQNAHVALVWKGEDDLPPVPMVRDRIQQVFLNLVLNAIDAMPEGGELRVRAVRTEDPPGVSISFTDTGVGIAPQQIGRLFEGLHSTKEMGLGLGLHVSRNIVREHGGRIEVESEPGHGTTFTVWLPLP
ncbi:MAG: PAS domain S-box protein [Anaerolineae bacterium]